MRKIVLFIIVFLLLNCLAMSQNIEFNERGLNVIQLDTKISDLQEASFDKIENHSNIKRGYRGGFANDFQYYYMKSDSMFIEEGGLVKDIFFATDHLGKVRGIFVVIEHLSDSLSLQLDKAFGSALLQSYSSIENIATNSKRFWKKDEVAVFMVQYPKEIYSEVIIGNSSLDEKSPGISIENMYR